MSMKFTLVTFEADDEEKKNQKDNNKFIGNCRLSAYERDQEPGIFHRTIVSKMLGYRYNKGTDYLKGLMECCINQMYDVSMSMSNSTVEYGSRKTENNLDFEMVNMLRAISNMLIYLSNSYSWREARFKEFDAIEFKNKIKMIETMCNFYEVEDK